MRLNSKIITAVLLSLILLTICSCEKRGQIVSGEELELKVPIPELSSAAGKQFIRVTAPGEWTLSFDFGDSAEEWAEVNVMSGKGSQMGIRLSWKQNEGKTPRTCTLVLSGDGETSAVLLSQVAPGGNGGGPDLPTELKADKPGKWMELPETNNGDLYFFTHERSDGKGRNWSFYLDPDAKLSTWVAYPLNKSLIGTGSRTNQWGLDPKVPRRYQPILYNGFSGRYQRGHQLPSADRLKYADNVSTFYFTNMTPQRGELNEDIWASLEGKVRDWSYRMDTLYVVTGADIIGSTEYAYDNEGSRIPVPVGYFKALLGYKKSGLIGPTTGGYVGIAFYFRHKAYDSYWTQSMTIDALEEELGYDFFVNLPDAIGEEKADAVESSIDNWWKNN